MTDIIAVLACINPYVTPTTVRQMGRIVKAMVAMTGRVTMLGVSRWTEEGGSYRTVQRFFGSVIRWEWVFWVFFKTHLWEAEETYLLVGDETVVKKAGHATHGLDRFFSSIYGKTVPGLSFFALALVSVQERRSYPMQVEQMVKSKAPVKPSVEKSRPARSVGRPKGRKTRDKTQVTLSAELQQVSNMVSKQLALVKEVLNLRHLVLDGKFGHNAVVQLARQLDLHLVSKLHSNVALYLPFVPPPSGRGRGQPRKYGDRLHLDNLPAELRTQSTRHKHIQTDIYQAQVWHKEFADQLNVVIIRKLNTKSGAHSHVILFSSDLDLTAEQIIDFYSLRFQIEFNFRDAKQFWGLDDFMNVQPIPVTNAANLSLFMVNIAHLLLRPLRRHVSSAGVLDLKAYFRGQFYLSHLLNSLSELPDPIFISRLSQRLGSLATIHSFDPSLLSP